MEKIKGSAERDFQALWRRALNEPSLTEISPELIRCWAAERKLNIVKVEAKKVGAFNPIDCIVLELESGAACFPKVEYGVDPSWIKSSTAAKKKATLWEKVEWFAPLWVSHGDADKLLKDVEHSSKKEAIKLFDYHMSTIYRLAFQAVCIEQIMPVAHSLRDFCPLAREAYLAFYSGYKAAAISSLIPVIEGAITRILKDSGKDLSVGTKVDRAIDLAIETAARFHFDQMWVPEEYKTSKYLFAHDERVFFLETFRSWMHASFFRNTGDYDGVTWLNRHIYAHATSSSWQQSANFSRLVVAIATLGVVESWHDDSHLVNFSFPTMDKSSTLLWEQAKFRVDAQSTLKLIEEKLYHENGSLVPELPTDDGVLLRSALLANDCMNDLVRPLRDAGWSVAVSEPDDKALYMTVTASNGSDEFKVALLYSCGTCNSIYKELEKSSVAILYRGPPYHQNSYAYGIKVHVGPVLAWQPPKAPQDRHQS